MNEEEVLDILRVTGAVTTGHFVLSSGRHSDTYVEKFRALEHPDVARALGQALADRFSEAVADVVISPAVGAVILGFSTALALGAKFVFTERESGRMTLRRGFLIGKGDRVLAIEDVVTTGASIRETIEAAEPGEVVGVGCLVDRSDGRVAGLESLVRIEAPSWDPDDCPLCKIGIPPEAPGSRHL